MRLDVLQPHALGRGHAGQRRHLVEHEVFDLCGVAFISRRPKPTRSGKPGWAPIATPFSRASAMVARIAPGSPAWKPQATLAEEMLSISAASWPIGQGPNDSPKVGIEINSHFVLDRPF